MWTGASAADTGSAIRAFSYYGRVKEWEIKADSVQGAAAPKQISTIIQPCSLHRDSITENKASVYVSGLVWIKKIFFFF